MKYIKLYESFLYKEVKYTEIDWKIRKITKFDQHYLRRIETFLIKIGMSYSNRPIEIGDKKYRIPNNHYISILIGERYNDSKSISRIDIYQCEDEWFKVVHSDSILGHTPEYYMCDQIDGLMSLLELKLAKTNESMTNTDEYYKEMLNNKYYQKIDKEDYKDWIDDRIMLNAKDISNIIPKNYNVLEYEGTIFITGEDEIRGYVGTTTQIVIKCDIDEWYYVTIQKLVNPDLRVFSILYYKCDQFGGLVKLLQDRDIIK